MAPVIQRTLLTIVLLTSFGVLALAGVIRVQSQTIEQQRTLIRAMQQNKSCMIDPIQTFTTRTF